jgi:hypothetical protein
MLASASSPATNPIHASRLIISFSIWADVSAPGAANRKPSAQFGER